MSPSLSRLSKNGDKALENGMGRNGDRVTRGAFVKALKRLIPEIEASHLVSAPAGIREQAVSPEGGLVDDFLIAENSPYC